MDEDVIGGRVSLVAEDGECRNFHRSVRALPAARGHAGRITCRHDIAGHSLNSRLCRVPGAWGGAAVGAVVGILFPPSIIGTALVGAAVGGVSGHLWRGMSRSDIKEFGEIIDAGQAALIIVGESKLEQAVAKAELKADKHVAKELDVSAKDVDKAVQEAAREVS